MTGRGGARGPWVVLAVAGVMKQPGLCGLDEAPPSSFYQGSCVSAPERMLRLVGTRLARKWWRQLWAQPLAKPACRYWRHVHALAWGSLSWALGPGVGGAAWCGAAPAPPPVPVL